MSDTNSFDKNAIQVLLELAIDNAVTSRMLMKFLINNHFMDADKINVFYLELKENQKSERKAMVQNLYERFGDLPPGLLEGEDSENTSDNE
jgi:hypothetical protein